MIHKKNPNNPINNTFQRMLKFWQSHTLSFLNTNLYNLCTLTEVLICHGYLKIWKKIITILLLWIMYLCVVVFFFFFLFLLYDFQTKFNTHIIIIINNNIIFTIWRTVKLYNKSKCFTLLIPNNTIVYYFQDKSHSSDE